MSDADKLNLKHAKCIKKKAIALNLLDFLKLRKVESEL